MKFGPIDVPEVTTEGVFPLKPDWGWSRVIEPQVSVHTFESGNRKVEQRFYLGDGARRYALRFDSPAAVTDRRPEGILGGSRGCVWAVLLRRADTQRRRNSPSRMPIR